MRRIIGRKLLSFSIVITLLASIVSPAFAADTGSKAVEPAKLSFAVMSDIHVGTEALYDPVFGVNSTKKFLAAVADIKALNPSVNLMLLNGDLTDKGIPAETNTMLSAITQTLTPGFKALLSPGNHEYYYTVPGDPSGNNRLLTTTQFFDKYKNVNSLVPADADILGGGGYFADSWIQGYHFIAVYPNPQSRSLNAAQLEWLDGKINEKAADETVLDTTRPVFLQTHIPFVETVYGSDDPSVGLNLNDPTQVAWRDTLNKYPQLICFTGHTHYATSDPRSFYQDGYTVINDGSVSFVNYGDEQDLLAADSHGLYVEIGADDTVYVYPRDFYNHKSADPYIIRPGKIKSGNSSPPTMSDQITVDGISPMSVNLVWKSAKDDIGISHYNIYANDIFVYKYMPLPSFEKAPDTQNYKLNGLTPNTNYTIKIEAVNTEGKKCPSARTVSFKTQALPNGYSQTDPDVLDIDFTKVLGNTVYDNSLNGNNATLCKGSPYVYPVAPNVNIYFGHVPKISYNDRVFKKNAAVFDGWSETIKVPSSASLNKPKNSLSIMTTFQLYNGPNFMNEKQPILSRYYGTDYTLYYDPSKKALVLIISAGGTTKTLVANKQLSTLVPYHVAVVYNGQNVEMYLNDELVASAPLTGDIDSSAWSDLYIGACQYRMHTPYLWFNGTIDTVSIYSRAVSKQEVSSSYAAFTDRLNTPTGGTPITLEPTLQKFVTKYAPNDSAIPAALNGPALPVPDLSGIKLALPNDKTAYTVYAPGENGVMWLGSNQGVTRIDLNNSEPKNRVQYFTSKRYLPDNDVKALLGDGNNGVWVKTTTGVSHIEMKPMILEDKVDLMTSLTLKYNDRMGFIGDYHTQSTADLSIGTVGINDNDGLWTSMFAAGECFRYDTLKKQYGVDDARVKEAKASATRSLEACMLLAYISGRGDGFVCRSYMNTETETHGDGIWFDKRPDGVSYVDGRQNDISKYSYLAWTKNIISPIKAAIPARLAKLYRDPDNDGIDEYKDSDIEYKALTSQDEILGHVFAYYTAFNTIAKDDPELEVLLKQTMGNIADHFITNAYDLIDATGMPTAYCALNLEKWNNSLARDPGAYVEGSFKSMLLLDILKVAAYITGDSKYESEYRHAAVDLGYAKIASMPYERLIEGYTYYLGGNLILGKWISDEYYDYSAEEMVMLTVYPLIKLESDPTLSGYYTKHMNYWFDRHGAPAMNPIWTYMYKSLLPASNVNIDDATWVLYRYPIDQLDWRVDNSNRKDVTIVPGNPYVKKGPVHFAERIAPDEDFMHKWNQSPFLLAGGGDGYTKESATMISLPYWFGRSEGIITEPVTNRTANVTGISLSHSNITFTALNQTVRLLESIKPANAKDRRVIWSTSNSGVAKVDERGKVIPFGNGTAVVTAKTLDGNFTASCTVTVNLTHVSVSSIMLETNFDGIADNTLVLAAGGKKAIRINVSPSNALNKALTVKSSDNSVATINSEGLITGISAGTAIITVESSANPGISASIIVTVF